MPHHHAGEPLLNPAPEGIEVQRIHLMQTAGQHTLPPCGNPSRLLHVPENAWRRLSHSRPPDRGHKQFRVPPPFAGRPETALPHKSCSSVHVENRPEHHIYAAAGGTPPRVRAHSRTLCGRPLPDLCCGWREMPARRRVSAWRVPTGIHSHKRGHARNFLQSVGQGRRSPCCPPFSRIMPPTPSVHIPPPAAESRGRRKNRRPA